MKMALFGTTIVAMVATATVSAAPIVVNVALDDIGSAFDSVITGTGSTVITAQVVSGQTVYNYVDKDGDSATVTITRPDGTSASPSGGYSSGGTALSGAVWNINPGVDSDPEPIPGFNSGLNFAFSSPVNAFGFEVGDWATCCFSNIRPPTIVTDFGVPSTGSGLWIAFDGGAATLPANALNADDNPGFAANSSFTNFIGAIDDTGFFSSVTFFGDGFGEFLVAGGTLRFASVPEGSVSPVPVPGTLALIALGLFGAAASRARRAA
jgi:hypothetical protein